MPSSASLFFDAVFAYDGSSFGNNQSLEMQSPAGTPLAVLTNSNHYLYLGHAEKFDMAIFDMDSPGSLVTLTWEYTNGAGGWTTFVPASARYRVDPDGEEGLQFNFDADGIEEFPSNILSDWSTLTVNSVNIYWVRVTAASGTGPTLKRIQMRPINAYCTTQDVFELMQLKNVLDTTDFSPSTVPAKTTVENSIMAAQSQIDYRTRKAWRPTYVADEYHEFNINGFKPKYTSIYKVLSLQIWSGNSWETKQQGRKNDYFFSPDTGMFYYSRFFLLPARFASYNAPVWKWGGGEFNIPVRVRYLAGRDFHTDQREAGMVFDISRKLAAVDIIRSADFGNLAVSGADRVLLAQRADAWSMEAEERMDSLRAFEVF